LEVFRRQDLLLGPSAAAPFLATELLDPLAFGGDHSCLEPFDPVEEETAGYEAVQRLGAFLLAFDGQPSGQVDQLNAGGGLVDLLAAGTRGADESLPEVFLADAEAGHSFVKGLFFFRRDGHFSKGPESNVLVVLINRRISV